MINQVAAHGYQELNHAGLHPVAVAVTLLGALQILLLPRRFVASAFLIVGILIPMEQQIILAGLHFPMIRILIACGVLRIIAKREHVGIPVTQFDKLFLAFIAAMSVVFVLQWREFDAVVNRCGFAYTSLGLYFIFRVLIRDLEDAKQLVRSLQPVVLIVAACMILEHRTGRNIFSVFGGVSEITEVREDRLRCQAGFGHPILAGAFGATALPLMLSLWVGENVKRRWLVVLSAAGAVSIVLNSASSGPLMAMTAGLLALAVWPWRHLLTPVRRVVIWILVVLHLLIMKASVWALIWRASAFAGSSGYHRYALVDNFITRFEEWWLLGERSTENWTGDEQMWDVANQFVATGITGGIWAFVLLVALLFLAFKMVGFTIRNRRLNSQDNFVLWCFGASLFAHCVGFIGIVYFDQMQVVWYCLLATFGSFYGDFAPDSGTERRIQNPWLKPAFYTILIMLVARLTAHDTRLFF